MRIKGATVHADNGRGQGYGICGVKAREFMGVKGVTANPMRVTCPKCERVALFGEKADDHAKATD